VGVAVFLGGVRPPGRLEIIARCRASVWLDDWVRVAFASIPGVASIVRVAVVASRSTCGRTHTLNMRLRLTYLLPP
jgi:hypothetical protein